MKKIFLSLFIFLFFSNNYAQYTDIINSNRPSESMSAFAVGRTVIQLESGIGYIGENNKEVNKTSGVLTDLQVRYGFYKEQLETVLEIIYQRDQQDFVSLPDQNRKGIKGTTIGLKYLIFDPFKFKEETVNLYSWKENNKFKYSDLIPIVSVYAGTNLNFSNNKFLQTKENLSILSPKIMIIGQSMLGSHYVFIANVFFDKITTPGQNLGYLATLTKGFNHEWSAFVENKGIFGKGFSDSYLSAGGAYLFHSNWQVDASVSKNFKDANSFIYAGVGVSWRSDTNYKDFMIKTPGKNNSDKEKTMKKRKKKEKEMLKNLPQADKKDKKYE